MTTIQKGNTTLNLVFLMVLASDHVSPATGKTVTVTLSKNGGAFGAASGGSGTATEISSGWYYLPADADDADTAGPLALHAAEASCDNTDMLFYVVDHNPTDLFATVVDDPGGDDVTAAQSLQISNAFCSGTVSDAPAGPLKFYAIDGTTERITITADADGNRTAVTRTLS